MYEFHRCYDTDCNGLAKVPWRLMKKVVKLDHFAMHCIVHNIVLFHNQVGLQNSLILQALELLPRASGASNGYD